MNNITVSVARDFSVTPGGRYKKDGDFSGEAFRTSIVQPRVEMAMNSGGRVLIDLDGTVGYATSFLEEAFGGLVREMHKKVTNFLVIETNNQIRRREVESYISEAEAKLK